MALEPAQVAAALRLVTDRAQAQAQALLLAGTTDDVLAAVPDVVAYYSAGTAALAADYYDDLRDEAVPAGRTYTASPVVELRDEKLRRGLLWAVEPLYVPEPAPAVALERMAQVVQLETARPFRATVLANQANDPAAVGWRRNAGDGCPLCRMLADRGAVYRQATARFATHPHCDCTAAPVFAGQPGPEASTFQYLASKRRKTPADRAKLREYLAARYP